jgi:hypothetical protein
LRFRRRSLFIIIVAGKNKILVGKTQLSKAPCISFARFGIDNLQNLIECDGRGICCGRRHHY